MKRILRHFTFILGTALATIVGWFGGHQKKEKYLERIREKQYAENRMMEQPAETIWSHHIKLNWAIPVQFVLLHPG